MQLINGELLSSSSLLLLLLPRLITRRLYKFMRIPQRQDPAACVVEGACSINRDHTESQRSGRELLLTREEEMEVQPEPELSLWVSAPAVGFGAVKSPRSSSSDSDGSGGSGGKKRKHFAWREEAMSSHASDLELQFSDPLPPDWEQCLDLDSGRMYYLNRKTMKKSWVRPRSSNKEEQSALNLELNISTTPSIFDGGKASSIVDDGNTRSLNGGGHMVAVPCANCHLLVMLCKSSPSCPNCKFVQPSMPAMPRTPPRHLHAVKPLETLSLLH